MVTDGQDGSYSLSFYKDEKTAKRLIAEEKGESVKDIDWDDEYENGYFSTGSMQFKLVGNKLELVGDELHVGSFGQ